MKSKNLACIFFKFLTHLVFINYPSKMRLKGSDHFVNLPITYKSQKENLEHLNVFSLIFFASVIFQYFKNGQKELGTF